MNRPIQRVFTATIATGVTIALLMLLEGILAAFDVSPLIPPPPIAFDRVLTAQDTIVWDRDLLYRYRPNCEFVGLDRTNSFGYRGPEFSLEKPADTVRVVCVGDSVTFGLGVRESDAWVTLLGRGLNALYGDVQRIEVLSFGVVGYSSFQSRRQLEIDVGRFAPDVVIYMPTAFNDATTATDRTDRERAEWNSSWMAAVGRSRIARSIGAGEPQYELPTSIELAASDPERRSRVSLAERRENLLAAARATHDLGAKLVLVRFASADSSNAIDPTLRDGVALVSEIATESRAVLIDAEAEFRDYAPFDLYSDGVHPSALGSRVLAFTILRGLLENGILPESPRSSFLATWARARRDGVGAVADELATLAVGGAPPEFVSALRRIDGMPPVAGAPGGPDDLFDRADPLTGRDRSPYALGWLALAGDRNSTQAARRFAEIEANVRPRDAFAQYLGIRSFDSTRPAAALVRWARAANVLEAALGIAPPPIDRRLGLARAALEKGDHETLANRVAEILRLNPDCAPAHVLTARAQGSIGQRGAMGNAVEAALRADPNQPEALAMAAVLATERSDLVATESYLLRALAVGPYDLESRYRLGRLWAAQGKRAEAQQHLRIVLSMNRSAYPDAERLYLELGGTLPTSTPPAAESSASSGTSRH